MAQLSEATIRDATQKRSIVKVGLNGYKSFTKNPTRNGGNSRLIWSFTILDGDHSELERVWSNRQAVNLCTRNGQVVPVRVAAFPVDRESFGLIEFL